MRSSEAKQQLKHDMSQFTKTRKDKNQTMCAKQDKTNTGAH